MSVDPATYQPTYVSLSAVPIQEEDVYSETDKREALFNAESELELDVNDGLEIPEEERATAHRNAVLNLATYHLTKGAIAPNNATLGDMADGGGQAKEHANTYLDTYERIIDGIQHADDEQGGSKHASVSVNTRDPDRVEHEYPYNKRRHDY